jgi:hypothetical protein
MVKIASERWSCASAIFQEFSQWNLKIGGSVHHDFRKVQSGVVSSRSQYEKEERRVGLLFAPYQEQSQHASFIRFHQVSITIFSSSDLLCHSMMVT